MRTTNVGRTLDAVPSLGVKLFALNEGESCDTARKRVHRVIRATKRARAVGGKWVLVYSREHDAIAAIRVSR